MYFLLEHCSSAMLGLLFIGCGALIALLISFIVQKVMRNFQFVGEGDLGETFSDAIGGMFALLFALVTVAVWQNYDHMNTTVSNEANLIHNIYRNLDDYPKEVGQTGQAMLRAYIKRVVEVEWPLMKRGGQDDTAQQMLADFNRLMFAYQPASFGELPRHSETLRLVNEHTGLRHDRVEGGVPYLDSSMWTGLLLAAAIYVIFSSFYRAENHRAYRVMIATLGAALGLVFFMLVQYNHVFLGPAAISSESLTFLFDRYGLGQEPAKPTLPVAGSRPSVRPFAAGIGGSR